MKKINTFFIDDKLSLISTIFIIALLLILVNCNKDNSDKIPITTNSEKALEYYNEGLELAEKFRVQEAVYFYLKALAEDNEFAMAYLQMTQVQTTPKQFMKYMSKAQSLINNVSEGERLLLLAAEAGTNNDREKQSNLFLELLEKYPKDERAHNTYANFLFNLQKYKTAIKHYKIALELNPALSQPYNMLGYAYRRLGNYEEAEQYFIQYIELIKDDPNSYDSYAELLLKKGEFESSIEYYRKALKIQPNFIASIIGIASNLMLLDRHEEACKELEKIEYISSDPGELKRMHFAKTVINVDRGNFDRAIEEIKMNVAISKEIKDDLALGQDLINLGVLHLMSGKYKDALKYYEQSIEFFERTNISQELKYYVRRQLFVDAGRVAWFQNDIGKLKEYKNQYESSSKKTLNLNEIRNTHELAGHINLLEEKYEDAIYEYKQANLENPIILYMMGTAYEELGDYKKSQKIYESVAHFNSLNNLNYAFIRKTALEKLEEYQVNN